MMKQWQFTKSGHPRDVLHVAEVPIPTTCAENEVLIKVNYVAFNSAIAYKLIAHYGWMEPLSAWRGDPCVPEMDFSGTVCELMGSKASSLFKPGDRVFGISPPWFLDAKNGVLREYVLAKYDHICTVPENVSLKDACCFGATGITSYYAMTERVKVKKGDRVFITGASGGVGVMAMQLARALVGDEGRVVVSCGGDKVAQVQSIGAAHEIIDYQKHSLPEYLKEKYSSEPFDVIYDTVGNDHELFNQSPSYLKSSGTFYAIGLDIGDTFSAVSKKILQTLSSVFQPVFLGGVPRKFIFESTKGNRDRFEGVAKLAKEGAIKAVIDSVYKFDDVINAYERQMAHKAVGKVVVEVAEL